MEIEIKLIKQANCCSLLCKANVAFFLYKKIIYCLAMRECMVRINYLSQAKQKHHAWNSTALIPCQCFPSTLIPSRIPRFDALISILNTVVLKVALIQRD